MTSTLTIAIKSSDNKIFQIPENILSMSNTLKTFRLFNSEGAVPVPNVDGKTMEKVLEWCEKHCDDPELTEEEKQMIGEWDEEYLKMNEKMLHNVNMAADYLQIGGLKDLCAKFIAKQKKTQEEIAELEGYKSDLRKALVEEIRRKKELRDMNGGQENEQIGE